MEMPGLEGIPIRVCLKKQKNSYIRIKEDGSVLVTAPLRVSKTYITGFVAKHTDWIIRERQKAAEKGDMKRPVLAGEREALRKLLKEYILFWEPRMGVKSAGFRIRDMKSRWGSCNVLTGMLTFNLQLVHYDVSCIEYVVVHELAHLIERGHNARFWAAVQSALPDYKERRGKLR